MCNAGNTYKLWLLINKCRLTWYCPRKLTSESQVMGWMQRSMLTYGFSSLSLARLASALYMCMCGGLWKRGGRDSTCICVDKCIFIYTPLSCLFTVSFYSIWRTPRSGVWITRSFCECANVHLWYIYGTFMVCLWYVYGMCHSGKNRSEVHMQKGVCECVSAYCQCKHCQEKEKITSLICTLTNTHHHIPHTNTHTTHTTQHTDTPSPSQLNILLCQEELWSQVQKGCWLGVIDN